jgi:hypothetical protein
MGVQDRIMDDDVYAIYDPAFGLEATLEEQHWPNKNSRAEFNPSVRFGDKVSE